MRLFHPVSRSACLLILLAAAGCGSVGASGGTSTASTTGWGGTIGTSGTVGSTGGTGSSGGSVSQSAVCARYVGCMGQVAPSGQAAILAAYGTEGSCWVNAATATECDQACETGLTQEHQDNNLETACALCTTGADCPSNEPICSDGSCECLKPAASCTDSTQCCSGTCSDGTCSCGGEDTLCGGTCVDQQIDQNDCGGCGNVCPPSAQCSAGVCTCPDSQTACGDLCVDVTRDDENCGGCGTACSGPTSSCTQGVCSCPEGELLCDGACVPSDATNCNGCGLACPLPATCGLDGCTMTSVPSLEYPPPVPPTCQSLCTSLGSSFSCQSAIFLPAQLPDCGDLNNFSSSSATCSDTFNNAPSNGCFEIQCTCLDSP